MNGFREAPGTAILIPESVPRERQVWTKDEWKILNRASDIFKQRGLVLLLQCSHDACRSQPIQKVPEGDGFVLRCHHLDRVFTKSF